MVCGNEKLQSKSSRKLTTIASSRDGRRGFAIPLECEYGSRFALDIEKGRRKLEMISNDKKAFAVGSAKDQNTALPARWTLPI